LGCGGEDTGRAWKSVEHGAQALARGGFWDDAVWTWRADELRETRAVRLFFFLPRIPGVAEFRLPVLEAFAEIVFSLIERAAEGVICEIDAGRGERAREEGEDVATQRI